MGSYEKLWGGRLIAPKKGRRGLYVSCTSGIFNKSTVSESRKAPCDDLWGESKIFTDVDYVSPVLSVEIL